MKQTDAILEAILNRLKATGGPYDPAALFMGVFTAIDDQGPATTMGDITEATGDMATRVALDTWGTPYKLNDGRWVVDNVIASFRPADETEGQVLLGYFTNTAATAGTLKSWELFDEPVNMPGEDSQVNIILRLTVDPSGRWSQSIVFNG